MFALAISGLTSSIIPYRGYCIREYYLVQDNNSELSTKWGQEKETEGKIIKTLFASNKNVSNKGWCFVSGIRFFLEVSTRFNKENGCMRKRGSRKKRILGSKFSLHLNPENNSLPFAFDLRVYLNFGSMEREKFQQRRFREFDLPACSNHCWNG